jgi:hypothetical protein
MNISFLKVFSFNEDNESIIVIKCFHKVINQGYFSFAQIEKEKIILINYSYSIDLKNKKKYVFLTKRDTLDRKYIRNFKTYKTEKEWAKEHLDTYRERYFKIFDVNFLNMSNREKLLLMDKLNALNR